MSYQEDRFTEIADTIRSVKGTEGLIKASDFAEEIESLPCTVLFMIRGSTILDNKFRVYFSVRREGNPLWGDFLRKEDGTGIGDKTSIYEDVVAKNEDEIYVIVTPTAGYTYDVVATFTVTRLNFDGTIETRTHDIIDMNSTIVETVDARMILFSYLAKNSPVEGRY